MSTGQSFEGVMKAINSMKDLKLPQEWLLMSPDGRVWKSEDVDRLLAVFMQQSMQHGSVFGNQLLPHGEVPPEPRMPENTSEKESGV